MKRIHPDLHPLPSLPLAGEGGCEGSLRTTTLTPTLSQGERG